MGVASLATGLAGLLAGVAVLGAAALGVRTLMGLAGLLAGVADLGITEVGVPTLVSLAGLLEAAEGVVAFGVAGFTGVVLGVLAGDLDVRTRAGGVLAGLAEKARILAGVAAFSTALRGLLEDPAISLGAIGGLPTGVAPEAGVVGLEVSGF